MKDLCRLLTAALLVFFLTLPARTAEPLKLLNVSYDPTRSSTRPTMPPS